jgi:AmmeMemoRadiSam system protein A
MNPKDILSESDQRALLLLARSAVQEAFETGHRPASVEVLPARLHEKRGLFVTLLQEGALRGCIGFPYPVRSLGQACQEAAYSAAFEDSRFPPLDPRELDGVEFEISALTPPAPIRPEQIKVGVHGLFIRKGEKSGLLLPQVAVEYRWNVEELLCQTCRKAGLPTDAWRGGAELFGFEAQIFSEGDLRRR